MPRGIDHLVLAVRDLDAARATYARLGFTLTPPARHPFGTSNALVQLHGAFLELLALADPAAIPPEAPGSFPFAAFIRGFLEQQEGAAMLVLQGDKGDRADFAAHGLKVHGQHDFGRDATGPDGLVRRVAFSVAFTGDPRLPEAGFYTCRHLTPDAFWHSTFQRHPNTARAINSAVMVAPDPADFHEFLSAFTGQREIRSTSLGIDIDTGAGMVSVLSPVAFHALFGEAAAVDALPSPRFMAYRLLVADLDAVRRALGAGEMPWAEHRGQVVVPAAAAHGVAIAFAEAGEGSRR